MEFLWNSCQTKQFYLYEMKKAAGAILWHCTDKNSIELHQQFCPKRESSWCKYQRDKITGKEILKANDIIKLVFF